MGPSIVAASTRDRCAEPRQRHPSWGCKILRYREEQKNEVGHEGLRRQWVIWTYDAEFGLGLRRRKRYCKDRAESRDVNFVRGLQCVQCGAIYSTRVRYTCPTCGITGILDLRYDYVAIGRILTRRLLGARPEKNHWRYRELLPIRDGAALPALSVGWTPVTLAASLAHEFGLKTLYLKDDGRNPTGSLKDRASSVGVVKAREKRCQIIACASTGNAASSLAGLAARLD